MKKIILPFLLTVVFGLLFITAFSQEKKPATPDERAAKLTGWMKTNLQLTADQEPKVQEINLKYANKSQAIMSSSEPKMKKAKAAKAQDQAKDTELKTVLTADQFKTYQTKKEELKKKMKAEMKERKQNG